MRFDSASGYLGHICAESATFLSATISTALARDPREPRLSRLIRIVACVASVAGTLLIPTERIVSHPRGKPAQAQEDAPSWICFALRAIFAHRFSRLFS